MYEKAIKMGPTANLQRLHQHNRQQPLPASHTSLAWGVTGASLYQSHTAVFTIASTMLCQLPQCKEKWMPVFGEKDRDEGSCIWDVLGARGSRKRKAHAANEIKVTPQKCSPLMKRFCETIMCFILKFKFKESKVKFPWKAGTSEPV